MKKQKIENFFSGPGASLISSIKAGHVILSADYMYNVYGILL
jgi:hypothetical protein